MSYIPVLNVAELKLIIPVLVGKKNLEVRPLAVNKGEIVRRLMYENPDADFVFCAGDDKVSLTLRLLFIPRSASKDQA